MGVDKLQECLTGCDLVLVPAGLPRKPGMTRADLLGINAGIAKGIVEAIGKFCPNAMVGLIVNPVNSVVPAMCELYKKKGLDPKRLIGVTTLDCVRANKFVHEITGGPVDKGGKGSATLSMAYAGARFGSAVLQGLAGQEAIECAYVQSDVVQGMSYFSSKVTFGVNGVMKVHPIGPL